MRAAIDWSPLADQDPVPGDPDGVARLARRYGDTAESILRQASNLRRLASDTGEGWDADAGRAFASHADGLADRLGKAHDRYAAAAAALGGWVGPLREAQFEAAAALTQAKAAEAEMQANQTTSLPAGSPANPVQEHVQRAAYESAANDLDAARRRLRAAVEDYQRTAQRLANDLRKTIDHDPLHDSLWDHLGGWIHDRAKIISETMKILGYVVTVLAIVALIVGVLFPEVGIFTDGFLLADLLSNSAALGTGVLLAGHTELAVTGDGSWVDVGLDVFALATFGIGRNVIGGMKASVAVAKSAAVETAARRAVEEVNVSNASRIRWYTLANRYRFIARVSRAESRLDQMAADARAAGEQARDRIENIPKVESGILGRAKDGGADSPELRGALEKLDHAVPGVPEVKQAVALVGRRARQLRALTYGPMAVDGTNHFVEDGWKVKERIIPYTTMPLVQLP
jgi:hypothetical protein